MAQSMNYAEVAQKQKDIVCEQKDLLILSFKEGKVQYTINKSQELLERERIQAEKNAISLEADMAKAVADIERRRQEYREKDMEDYGYDHYTKEFYYECPESSDEEEEEDCI